MRAEPLSAPFSTALKLGYSTYENMLYMLYISIIRSLKFPYGLNLLVCCTFFWDTRYRLEPECCLTDDSMNWVSMNSYLTTSCSQKISTLQLQTTIYYPNVHRVWGYFLFHNKNYSFLRYVPAAIFKTAFPGITTQSFRISGKIRDTWYQNEKCCHGRRLLEKKGSAKITSI